MKTEIRCRCGWFLGEFIEKIPRSLQLRLRPCKRCKTITVVQDGVVSFYPPETNLPEGFDRGQAVA